MPLTALEEVLACMFEAAAAAGSWGMMGERRGCLFFVARVQRLLTELSGLQLCTVDASKEASLFGFRNVSNIPRI